MPGCSVMPQYKTILNQRERQRSWISNNFALMLGAWRWLRANSRDSLALFREFRLPLLVLVITIGLGTVLYSWLYFSIYGETMPLATIPYLLLSLMLFQQPEGIEMPPALPLMLFWYTMPLVGLYVLAHGAAESTRLFFNRQTRVEEWTQSVASTYKHHIILVGLGQVGERVTKDMAAKGLEYNLIVINTELSDEQRAWLKELKVLGMAGDARKNETLIAANIESAATLLVCTSEDNINFDIVMSARSLNENLRIVCRVWHETARSRLRQNTQLRIDATYSTSSVATPAFVEAAVGVEIANLPPIGDVDYSLFHLKVSVDSLFANRTVQSMQDQFHVSVVMLNHHGIPDVSPEPENIVQVGDTIMIFAEYETLVKLIASNHEPDEKPIIIMGVGHVGERITNLLMALDYKLTVIDHNMPPGVRARLKAQGCRTITGDGANKMTLNDAKIFDAGSMIICTANDRLNFDVSLLAKDMQKDLKIIARVHDTLLAEQMQKYLGVAEVISPADVVSEAFVGEATGSVVAQTFKFDEEDYSTARVRVKSKDKDKDKFDRCRIDFLENEYSVNVLVLERHGKVDASPLGSKEIQEGDELVIFGPHDELEQILR